MDIRHLIKLADLLDSSGEYHAAREVDQLIIRVAEEQGITLPPELLESMQQSVDTMNDNIEDTIEFLKDKGYTVEQAEHSEPTIESVAVLQQVFSKLADVADDLDVAGADKEADMVDAFIQKYASDAEVNIGSESPSEYKERVLEESPALEKHVEGVYEELNKILANPTQDHYDLLDAITQYRVRWEEEQKPEQLPGVDLSLGPAVEEEAGEISEELQKLESIRMSEFAKQADDPDIYNVVTWKDEADTEQSKRYDDRHHHNLQTREPKKDQERVDREGRDKHHIDTFESTGAAMLSSRYCPDHIGVQMGRVGEATYQCPLDGKSYNWETGYTDYEGNQHPGGSVAAQTPDSSGYGIPHRIFNTRENTINEIN